MSADPSQGPRLRVVEWRSVVKNTLRGFAKVRLPNGLIIRDVTVHYRDGKAWASMPSKPVLGEDGRQKEEDGKKAYAFIISWETRELSDGFSHAVLTILDRDYSGWRG